MPGFKLAKKAYEIFEQNPHVKGILIVITTSSFSSCFFSIVNIMKEKSLCLSFHTLVVFFLFYFAFFSNNKLRIEFVLLLLLFKVSYCFDTVYSHSVEQPKKVMIFILKLFQSTFTCYNLSTNTSSSIE